MERTDFYRVHQTKDLTDHGNWEKTLWKGKGFLCLIFLTSKRLTLEDAVFYLF